MLSTGVARPVDAALPSSAIRRPVSIAEYTGAQPSSPARIIRQETGSPVHAIRPAALTLAEYMGPSSPARIIRQETGSPVHVIRPAALTLAEYMGNPSPIVSREPTELPEAYPPLSSPVQPAASHFRPVRSSPTYQAGAGYGAAPSPPQADRIISNPAGWAGVAPELHAPVLGQRKPSAAVQGGIATPLERFNSEHYVLTPRTARALTNSDTLLQHYGDVVFKQFDINSDRVISREELSRALNDLHQGLKLPPPSMATTEEALAKYDTHHSGTLDKEEFLNLFRSLLTTATAAMPPIVKEQPPVVAEQRADARERGSDNWLGDLVRLFWPWVRRAVRNFVMHGPVVEELQKQLPGPLKEEVSFTSFEIGHQPPRFGRFRVQEQKLTGVGDKGGDLHSIVLEVPMELETDTRIELTAGRVKVSVKNLTVRGRVCICFTPLLDKVPVAGGLQVYFVNTPEVDLHFGGALKIVELPLIQRALHSALNSAMRGQIVLPNRISVPLLPEDESVLEQLGCGYARPEMVVRIQVLKARGLNAADWALLGKGSSDPYAVVKLGSSSFKTDVISNTVDPVWDDAVGTFVVFDRDQQVTVKVWDKDPVKSDDFLGDVQLSVQKLLRGEPRHADGCSWHQHDLRLNTSQVKTDETLRSVISLRACQLRFSSNPQRFRNCTHCMLVVKLLRGSLPFDIAKQAAVQLELGGEKETSAKPTLKEGGAGSAKLSPETAGVVWKLEKKGMSINEISEVVGEDPALVRDALRTMQEHYKRDNGRKGSMLANAVWNQPFRLLAERPACRDLQVRLLRGRKEVDTFQVSVRPLTSRQPMTTRETYHLKEVGGCLDLALELLALVPAAG